MMEILQELLQDVPLPRMVKIRQTFAVNRIANVEESLRSALATPDITAKIVPGMKVAVAVGSRGLADLPLLVRTTVACLKDCGAHPFIVPSMGSHGGATADGQREVLANLGVTENSAGCPIHSSMEVDEIGRLPNGLPVYIDRCANAADGIVVINRVKPHTAFRGASESGLVKMLTIGLGKQKGAASCHAYSFKYMAQNIIDMAKVILDKTPVLFGVGTVENAYDQIAKIVAVPAEQLIAVDQQLQQEAKANMPYIPFKQIDVLLIDQIGKDISGDGMDPNVTGRYPTPYATGGPSVSKMAVLDLTERTHGNANGMGTADFTTRRLVEKTDFAATYANGLTSTVVTPTHTPTVLENERDVVRAAVKTSNALDLNQVRIVHIKDTLHLGEMYISEALLSEAHALPQVTILTQPAEMAFDNNGNFRRPLL